METFALPLASAAFFTLGCAMLQTFRQYAERVTPILLTIAMLLVIAILTVASVQYQLSRGDQILTPDPWTAIM
jgi:uncharacterized membrane protein YoaK (UPF0700 family)